MNITLRNGKIELIRYIIKYKQSGTGTDRYLTAANDAERDRILSQPGLGDYTITEVDQSGNEWIEGVEFDSWEAAKAALTMGEAAYKRSISASTEQQITDIQMAVLELANMITGGAE